MEYFVEIGAFQKDENNNYEPEENILWLANCFALTHGFMRLESYGYDKKELLLSTTLILQGGWQCWNYM